MQQIEPLDRDLVYTIEGASDIRTKYFCYPYWWKRNNFVVHVIFFRLELLWCYSLLSTFTTGKEALDRTTIESLFTICKPALTQWILGARKAIDTCNYFAVELSVLSQENLWKRWSAWKPGVLRGCIRTGVSCEDHAFFNVPFIVYIF